ncbi:MAG: hypothetical protein JW734_00815 [Candidatus Omnitrophica bacterium]|nr:hypothetical protein [Candidatus Omnitrophota bacterium]
MALTQNIAKQRKVEKAINNCISAILDSGIEQSLDSLVLIGSFSRGEGVVWGNNGELCFLSDVEFVGVSKTAEFKRLKTEARRIEEEIKNNMAKEGIDIKVNLGFTTRNHLKRFNNWIYPLEIKRFGKVVWGDEKTLSYIPDFTYEDIEPQDGFILLNNRIVEQLILLNKIRGSSCVTHFGNTQCPSADNIKLVEGRNAKCGINRYEIDKGYIQIANSILAFEGRYRSFYEEKIRELMELFADTPGLLKENSGLLRKVKQVLACFYNSDFQALKEKEALREWKELRDYFRQIWMYEVKSLLRAPSTIHSENSEDRELEVLIEKFVKIPNLVSRVKGWLKVFAGSLNDRHPTPDTRPFDKLRIGPDPFGSVQGKLRRMGRHPIINLFRSSPQFLIYQEAVRQYFSPNPDMEKVRGVIRAWEELVK